MTKNNRFATKAAVASVLLLTASLQAQAFTYTVQPGTSNSTQAGASTITFGTSPVNNTTSVAGNAAPNDVVYAGINAGVGYSFLDGALYNPSISTISGITARPIGSVDNFWSVGSDPAEQVGPGLINFTAGLSYFGFLWGSPDTYNTVSFYNGATLLGSVLGTAVLPPGSGDQSASTYFNFFAGPNEQITRVTFSSNQNAFETDNMAFIAAPVPEPETYAMLLGGLGLISLVLRRRKQQGR
ncbi:MAG: PEP-CTERM sorting domain-containing protein [Rhodoferax sp.]|nr:PEP-CTERM sorting domain-containing protein [Rhodoferax sp.]